MSTALAPVDARAVILCDECGLVQFVPCAGLSSPCRRCHIALDHQDEPPAPHPTSAPPTPFVSVSVRLAITIKAMRLERGLSQRQLAARMNTPRTYISKCEQGKCCPSFPSIEKMAAALAVPMADLLDANPAPGREAEVRELTSDKFISELLPFVTRLNAMQMASILGQCANITRRRNLPRLLAAAA
jgi:transcriptional regulator with XRE-family HTH domain